MYLLYNSSGVVKFDFHASVLSTVLPPFAQSGAGKEQAPLLALPIAEEEEMGRPFALWQEKPCMQPG